MPLPPFIAIDSAYWRPLVARDTVRFVGDIVAVILSEDRASGEDAAELVIVDYEPLPVVVDALEAVEERGPAVPGGGHEPRDRPCAPGARPGAVQRMRGRRVGNASQPAHGGVPARAAVIGGDLRGRQADLLALDADPPPGPRRARGDPRARAGGGAGDRTRRRRRIRREEPLRRGRHPRLVRPPGRPAGPLDREPQREHDRDEPRALADQHVHDRCRRATARSARCALEILQDAGAYPGFAGLLPHLTALMASGVYAIPTIESHIRVVATNTTPIAAFRGAGRPEATQTIERAMDLLAAEGGDRPCGGAPAQLHRPRRLPLHDGLGRRPMTSATTSARSTSRSTAAGYAQLREDQAERRSSGAIRQIGIGISTYVEVTNGIAESEFGEVEIQPDGSAILRTGSFSHGQGHETTFAQIVSDRLGIPVEKVTVQGRHRRGRPRHGHLRVEVHADRRRRRGAGRRGGARPGAPPRRRHARGEPRRHRARSGPRRVPCRRLRGPGAGLAGDRAARAAARDGSSSCSAQARFQRRGADRSRSAPTSRSSRSTPRPAASELQRLIAVDDAGTIINPMIAARTGRRRRGHRRLPGALRGGRLRRGRQPADRQLPRLRVPLGRRHPVVRGRSTWSRRRRSNPLGAKGIGESGTIGATPAVHNAVIDALAPFGVTHVDMPANGERVWRALQEAAAR